MLLNVKSKDATPDDLASYQPREVFAISDNPYGQNRRTPSPCFYSKPQDVNAGHSVKTPRAARRGIDRQNGNLGKDTQDSGD